MCVKIFKCPHCGNIVTKLYDSGVPLVCCGEEMEELQLKTIEEGTEKHLPMLSIKDNTVKVTVSTQLHPSTMNHHISFIILETTKGFRVERLSPEAEPSVTMKITDDEEVISVYAYCNVHGLWKNELPYCYV